MTIQLTKKQIDAIKTTLAQYGLDVRPILRPKATKGDKWAKRHALRMAKTWRNIERYGYWKDAVGVTSYQVRHPDGQWRSEGQAGFAEAVDYQKAYWAKAKGRA